MPSKSLEPRKIQSLAFVVNANKPGALRLAEKLQHIASQQGIKTSITTDYPIPDSLLARQDICCVIGGDGTLLSVAKEAVKYQVPTLGVNQGKLGFLATFSAFEAERRFGALLKGYFKVVPRALLCCKTASGKTGLALNDVVIKHGSDNRLSSLEVYSDAERVTDYYCDGLIFSTPTGSTAYNLSAGGPIIFPNADVISMTPICPHTLSNRSVIFSHNTHLKICSADLSSSPVISLDGRTSITTNQNAFPIEVFLSEKTFPLVQVRGYSYARVLRSKLKWG